MLKVAADKHREAWESLVSAAKENAYAHYALYASRTLAVRHPDVYLKGDRWFFEGASRLTGFARCYEEPTSLAWCHMEYGRPFFEGGESFAGIVGEKALDFDAIDLASYRPTEPRLILPGPFEPLLDHRFGPLAVTLKTEGRVTTPLEMAEIAYFQEIARGSNPAQLFLALAVDETAYLVHSGQLLALPSLRAVNEPTAPVFLVFNEEAVSYPLMAREDDNELLQRALSRVGALVSPDLDPWEADVLESLRDASMLANDRQKTMAALASTRATGWKCHPFYPAWLNIVPEDDFDITISRRLCLIRDFDRRANAVSPAAAYLYGVALSSSNVEGQMRRLSREYLIRTAVVREAEARGWKPAWRLESWGHVWPCGLMEHTIDDAFRSRTGHCVSQCHMVGAVLSLLDVPHVIVNFDRGGVKEGISHHFVLSQDGAFLFDDGIVNFRGVDQDTEDYGPLLSFAIEGEWARTVGSGIYGNVSAGLLPALLNTVAQALDTRFQLEFLADRSTRKTLSMDVLLEAIKTDGIEEVKLP